MTERKRGSWEHRREEEEKKKKKELTIKRATVYMQKDEAKQEVPF